MAVADAWWQPKTSRQAPSFSKLGCLRGADVQTLLLYETALLDFICTVSHATGPGTKEEEPFLKLRIGGSCIDLRESSLLAKKVFADERLRNLMLQLHDGGECQSSFMDNIDSGARLMTSVGLDYARSRRWARVWNLNAFRYHGVNMGLFLAGSLFNHSCAPNALYQTISSACAAKPEAIFRAVRDITAGEEVTIDYTFVKNPSIDSRQHQLKEEKLFQCDCPRCSGPDFCRSMRCPTNGSSRLIFWEVLIDHHAELCKQ